jgi:hypothetical protein
MMGIKIDFPFMTSGTVPTRGSVQGGSIYVVKNGGGHVYE